MSTDMLDAILMMTPDQWKRLLVDLGEHFDMNLRYVDDCTVGKWVVRFLELAAEGREQFYEERGARMDLKEWMKSGDADAVLDDAALQAIEEVIPLP